MAYQANDILNSKHPHHLSVLPCFYGSRPTRSTTASTFLLFQFRVERMPVDEIYRNCFLDDELNMKNVIKMQLK